MSSSAPKPLLTVKDLAITLPKGSDRPFAIDNINFTLYEREILCIAGESGSGKSVLSAALMGAIPNGLRLTKGNIWLEGCDLTSLSEKSLAMMRGHQMAMIFQEPIAALNPTMKIGKQVEEIFEIHSNFDAKLRHARVGDLLHSTHLPNIERIMQSYPHQLSGGQCQRVIIAMALAMQPKILIADEPTTALDVTTQAQILQLVRNLRDIYGHGIIFITHDFGVVAELADRVGVMRQGELVELGTAKDALKNPAHAYTRELINTVPSLRPPAPVERAEISKIALQVENLSHQYGALPVLKNISFSLRQGETVSIVGESGCGKSTLAKALVRLIEPSCGKILLGKQDFVSLARGALRTQRKKIQMIFQDPHSALNPRRTIGAILVRAGQLAGLDRHAAKEQARQLLELVGLEVSAYWRRPSHFSGGQRQRACIARALAMKPDILIADESVSALDVSVQAQVLDLLRHLQKQFKLAILFITHDLRVAAQISDRIIVMRQGEIVEVGETSQILQNPTHLYTRRLIEAAPARDIF